MSTYIVTGGTGFVGAALILELLQQTDADLLCLVRLGKEDVDTRLYNALRLTALAHGYDRRILALAQQRCNALEADMDMYCCGCHPSKALGSIAQFWHCAASLRYQDEYQEEIYRTNVMGTHNALELAKRLKVESFNYLSTVAVEGKRTGLLLENIYEEDQTPNHYSRSKLQAELLVARTTEMRIRVFRPSGVISHSRTYTDGIFTGILYVMARKLLMLKESMARLQVGYLTTEAPRLRGDPAITVNLIPVDMVAQQAVRIAFSSSSASVFHLTNSTSPTLGAFLPPFWHGLGIHKPILVPSKEAFTTFDHQLDEAMEFYTPYLLGERVFDRSNSNAALGDEHAGDFPMDEKIIKRYVASWCKAILEPRRVRAREGCTVHADCAARIC
ncbi:MAG: SDR family oxidoreductase [Ktedonobacteraceae bacterium]|nr:SDR family oxidoreductase [Ktedonobacteraceae bacterium]